jgi:L-malate glycosyltransferase
MPLRVCHVMSADLWAGAEVQVATLASYLAGCPDVCLSVVLFNDGPLACELRGRGIDVAVISEREHHALAIVGFLAAHFRARHIDIVHTHRYKDNLLATVAATVTRVPHIIRTVHGLTEPMRGWPRLKYRAFDTLDRLALSHFAHVVIAVSRHTAAALKEAGYRPRSLRSIHNGIDMVNIRATRSREDVRRELGFDGDSIVIGTAGRLTPVKAQDDFLRAAQLILTRHPHFRFLVVGCGPDEHALTSLASELGIEQQIVFAGGRRDVHSLIAAMDVFALPSLAEGMPMALLEAMALGTPVVATAVGGVPELIEDRSNGWLVPPRDPRALADACLALAVNRPWAETLAARARQTVADGFTRDTNGGCIAQLYREVTTPRWPTPCEVGETPAGALGLSMTLLRGAFAYATRRGRRALDTVVARRRVRRLRHDPSPVRMALGSAQRILIVCQGNIIRSPFAARLVAQALHSEGRVSVISAGLSAVAGRPPHPTAAQIAMTHSVDLSGHAASPLGADAVQASDVIFVMDIAQLVAMHERFPHATGRTFLLTSLAFDAPLEIADPVDGDESRFQVCFEHISTAVRPIVHTLCGSMAVQ